MFCIRHRSTTSAVLLALAAIVIAPVAAADDDSASADAPMASIAATGCLQWDMGGKWYLVYDGQTSHGDLGLDLATAVLPPTLELQQTGAQIRGSIVFPQILGQPSLGSGTVVGTVHGNTFELTGSWHYTQAGDWDFVQTTILTGQIGPTGGLVGKLYSKEDGPERAADWHSERGALCKDNVASFREIKQDHSHTAAAILAPRQPEPGALALGRVRTGTALDPSKTMCDYARSAKARNSPAAPALEKRCLEGGGSMTPPPPPPPAPVAAPDLDALAAVGAAIAEQDPAVAEARTAEAGAFYPLGFDIASGLFGDPALGAAGNTIMGPGSTQIRSMLSAAGQRGFDASVKFHQARKYKH